CRLSCVFAWSAALACALASLDSTWRRIFPHRSSSHEMLPGSVKSDEMVPTPKPWPPRRGADTRERLNDTPRFAVGYQLLRACHTSVRACWKRASAAATFWLATAT